MRSLVILTNVILSNEEHLHLEYLHKLMKQYLYYICNKVMQRYKSESEVTQLFPTLQPHGL